MSRNATLTAHFADGSAKAYRLTLTGDAAIDAPSAKAAAAKHQANFLRKLRDEKPWHLAYDADVQAPPKAVAAPTTTAVPTGQANPFRHADGCACVMCTRWHAKQASPAPVAPIAPPAPPTEEVRVKAGGMGFTPPHKRRDGVAYTQAQRKAMAVRYAELVAEGVGHVRAIRKAKREALAA